MPVSEAVAGVRLPCHFPSAIGLALHRVVASKVVWQEILTQENILVSVAIDVAHIDRKTGAHWASKARMLQPNEWND